MSFETLCVVGLGYIGLPTAVLFASRRKKVIGVDVNADVVATINKGEVHIVEPELDLIVHSVVQEGLLTATTQVQPADAFLVAVPTPLQENNQADLSYVASACRSIAGVLKAGDLVILESTSPVGTTEQMADWLAAYRPDLSFPQTAGEKADVQIAHCPERVLPGHVLRELVENDRIIGGMSNYCTQRSIELYKIFVEGECIATDVRTAEMAKLTENAFRDVNIAFANELSVICDKLAINVWELIRLANRHPRVDILKPGPGVGGHCIAIDPWFIVAKTPEEATLIHAARSINDAKPQWVLDKIDQAIAQYLKSQPMRCLADVSVACLGLAFKADIDDLRESPALAIATKFAQQHAGKTLVVEPNITECPKSLNDNASLVSLEAALDMANVVVLLVDHKAFKECAHLINAEQQVLDTRGIWC